MTSRLLGLCLLALVLAFAPEARAESCLASDYRLFSAADANGDGVIGTGEAAYLLVRITRALQAGSYDQSLDFNRELRVNLADLLAATNLTRAVSGNYLESFFGSCPMERLRAFSAIDLLKIGEPNYYTYLAHYYGLTAQHLGNRQDPNMLNQDFNRDGKRNNADRTILVDAYHMR